MTRLRLTRATLGKLGTRSLGSVCLALVFCLALAAAAVLHLDLPVTRRAASRIGLGALNGLLQGKLEFGALTRLDAFGLTMRDIAVRDPSGRLVLSAKELDVDLDLFGVARRFLSFYQKLSIEIERVDAQGLNVVLYDTLEKDEAGQPLSHPSLVDAFRPRSPSSQSSSTGRAVRVWFGDLRLDDVYLASNLANLPHAKGRLSQARGTLLVTDKGVALDVNQLALTASGLGLRGVDGSAEGELHLRAPGALSAKVHGKLGQVPWQEDFRMEHGKLTLNGALPDIQPGALRALLPAWPLDQAISLEHEISGVPPRLNATAKIHSARGDAAVSGIVTVSPSIEADLDVDTQDLDLSALNQSWPASKLSLRSAAELWFDDTVHVELNATLLPSRVMDNDVPAIDFVGTSDERGIALNATFHERGLPLHLELTRPVGGQLAFELQLRRTEIAESPRLMRILEMRGNVVGSVSGKLEGDRVATQTTLHLDALRQGTTRVDSLDLSGSAVVPIAAPLDTELGMLAQAKGVHIGSTVLTTASLRADGLASRPRLSLKAEGADGAHVTAALTTRTDRLEIDDAKAEVTGRGTPLEATLSHLHYADGRLVVKAFHLQSEGRLDADLDLGRSGGSVHLVGSNLNLARLAEVAGLPQATLSGRLDATVDAELGSSSHGKMDIQVRSGEFRGFRDIDAHITTSVEDRSSTGHIELAMGDYGRASGDWNGVLAGGPFEEHSYRDATGSVHLELGSLDLEMVGRLLGLPGVNVRSGVLTGHADINRASARALPAFDLVLDTSGLGVDLGEGPTPMRWDGADLHWASNVKPEENRVEVVARADDFAGDIVSAAGSLELPLTEWGSGLPPLDHIVDYLNEAPLELVVSVPRRNIGDFPPALGLPNVTGTLAGRGTARGTLSDPSLQLTLAAQRVNGKQLGLNGELDADSTFRYSLSTGRFSGDVRTKYRTNQIAAATFDLVLPWANLTTPVPAGTAAWTGRCQLVLDGAPLEILDYLNRDRISGEVQGAVTIERTDYMPHVDADVRLRRLMAGSRSLGEGNLTLQNDGTNLLAKAAFEDDYGALDTQIELGTVPTPWIVLPDDQKPVYVTLRSEKYDAAVLSPFVGSVLTEISGALNGTLRLELRPPDATTHERHVRFSGQMRLSEAVLTPAAMGLRLEDTSVDLNAGPEGNLNVLRLTNIRARARSSNHNLSGSATLYFQDLSLERGQFDLHAETVPLLSDGVKLGDVSGDVSASVSRKDGEVDVAMSVPRLDVDLTQSSDHKLIELSDNPTIEILQPLRKAEEVASASGPPTAYQIQVQLGQAVHVRNRIVTVQLTGNPSVRYTDHLSVNGQIQLEPGGRIQVMGRVFIVDHGTVAFDTEEVSNPHLDVSATWRAPNGVLVRATVSGTANDPDLKWSSDPPMAGGEPAIIATVLGSGSSQTGDASGAGLATSAAIVNEVVGQTGVRGIDFYATRQSSNNSTGQVARLSDQTWDNYTAAYQISDQLWFEGSYKQESVGPGKTPRSGFSGTLDWRFDPAWSLRTEVGSLGIGSDVLWQYRY